MSWLGLDGALGAFSAALLPETGPPRTAVTSGNDALENGLTVVERVLGDTRLERLAGIAVGTGPGGYTGLRIALSYAKGLAFAAGRPLVGISSYDAVVPAGAREPHAAFVHGRLGIGCVRLRGIGDELVCCGTYEALAEALAARMPEGGALDSYGAAEGATRALGERGIIVRALANVSVPPALAIARRAKTAPVNDSAHAVRADYGEAHYGERVASTVPDGGRSQP